MKEIYIKDYSYPLPKDPELLSKIYKKREFHINKIEPRKILKKYEDIQIYRETECAITKEPKKHQLIVKNILTPDSPYKGLLLMYGVGTGKTLAAIQIAEQFKEQVKKYNTKIHVLVPGPNTKNNFINEILETTNNVYYGDKNLSINNKSAENEKKVAYYNLSKYYNIMSYKSFYKKILGEKIIEKKLIDNKIKSINLKNTKGDIQRTEVINKIHNLNNTLLIVDEVHNLSNNNEYGNALKEIIKKSKNLKILILTATPMINISDQIVEILNYIKPLDQQIQRDKIFTTDRNYNIDIKPGGLEYLQMEAKGYVSYYRGLIPYTFAKREDIGSIPPSLLFTKFVRCYMSDFQYNNYINIPDIHRDSLDRVNIAASNIIFPIFTKDIPSGIYTYNIIDLKNEITTNKDFICNNINKYFFNNKINDYKNIIYLNDNETITGLILKQEYIKTFSTKFYELLLNLDKIFYEKSTIGFIYSNYVKIVGVELISEILLQNGYLAYKENFNDYKINDNTIHYKTKRPYVEYKLNNNTKNFFPATFLTITGEVMDNNLQEYNQNLIRTKYNNKNNIEGKYIKIILGTRVMSEGITLKNCCSVHIMDTFYNIPKLEQVIGRALRMCVHMDSINDNNKHPIVEIYKYVVSIDDRQKNKLSIDEQIYKKAEKKYLIIKKIEYALKKISIDCPLLLNMNIFPEDIETYNNCVYPTEENVKSNKLICPALCDFQKCDYKCNEDKLNLKYWDNDRNTYKMLKLSEIDYNTFTNEMYDLEVLKIIKYIIQLYKKKIIYIYEELHNYIKLIYNNEIINVSLDYLLNKALNSLIPITINDFNNFKYIIYDKYNRSGYLIQRNKYYIFQPFDLTENVKMYYRKVYNIKNENKLFLQDYISNDYPHLIELKKNDKYDFENNNLLNYYNNRNENSIVGIIDDDNGEDIFKIRNNINYNTNKKRGIGIQSFKGSVCTTAHSRKNLLKVLIKIKEIDRIKYDSIKKFSKDKICNIIMQELLNLEKNSKGKDKKTYIIIPYNHKKYQFPYNIEDRIQYIKENIIKIINNGDIIVNKEKDVYTLKVEKNIELLNFINRYNFEETTKHYIITIK